MKKESHKLRNLLTTVCLATVSTHLVNMYIASQSLKKNLFKEKEKISSYYSWRYGNVYYEREGSGSPVLLIHDLTVTGNAGEWESMKKNLAKKHTVYSMDLLGCGRSDKPFLTYTNFLYVQLITDFIEKVIKEKADVIASGFSTSLVITAANYKKSLFGKLFLVNPVDLESLEAIPSKVAKAVKYALDFPIFGRAAYFFITSKSRIELSLQSKFYNTYQVDGDLVEKAYESAHVGGGKGRYLLSSLLGNYVNLNVTKALHNLDNPIKIIYGADQPDMQKIITNYLYYKPDIICEMMTHVKQFPQTERSTDFFERLD